MMAPDQYIDLLIKGAIALFVSLAWGLILYPIIRKLKGSWPILLVIVFLLSSLSFILKEYMDRVTPLFDQYFTYALGIILALGIFFISLREIIPLKFFPSTTGKLVSRNLKK